MKLGRWRDPAPVKRPLRSFAELAQELGVDPQLLSGCMNQHSDAPKPMCVAGKSMSNSKRKYYDPVVFRKWWRDLQAIKQQEQS